MTSKISRIGRGSKRGCIAKMVVAAAFAFASTVGSAQDYPDKPIRVIVPWPAGGIADVVVRVIAAPLSERLRQPVIVENRTGANGIVGANIAVKSPGDGYTLFAVTSEIVSVNPAIYAKLPYDVLTDFVPITPVVHYFYALTGRPGLPGGSMKDVVKLIKSQPGKVTYSSWGIGSLGHLGMESLAQANGLQLFHIPYTGGPGAYNAIVAGHVDLGLMPAGMADSFRKGGKLKAISVPSRNRLSLMDSVATFKEEGYPLEVVNHVGFIAPAKTSANIVRKLHRELSSIMELPNVRAALSIQAAEPFLLSSDDYSAFIRSEIKRWGDIARAANVKIELEK